MIGDESTADLAGPVAQRAEPGAGRVAVHRAVHLAFNRRDLDEVARHVRPGAEFTDHARRRTVTAPVGLLDMLRGWIIAFPNAVIDAPSYINGGDYTVAKFHLRGVNRGPLGSIPSSGRRVDIAICEVLHFDSRDRIVAGDLYYDALGTMVQLGYLHPPRPA
jgi:predicted ester cyclase